MPTNYLRWYSQSSEQQRKLAISVPMPRDLQIQWQAHVQDSTGQQRDLKYVMEVEPRMVAILAAQGPDTKDVLMAITGLARKQVLNCGVKWKCRFCPQKATTSVNTPASYPNENPPLVADYAFMLLCGKPRCESEAYRFTQEAISATSQHMKEETGVDLMDSRILLCKQCGKGGRGDANNIKLQQCSRCRTVWYCSKECQQSNWRDHKSKCLKVPAKKP
jgi:hypothetical protein